MCHSEFDHKKIRLWGLVCSDRNKSRSKSTNTKLSHLKRLAIGERPSRTLKVIAIAAISCILVSLPVSGLLLQHLYLSPFSRYYHFSSANVAPTTWRTYRDPSLTSVTSPYPVYSVSESVRRLFRLVRRCPCGAGGVTDIYSVKSFSVPLDTE